MKSKDFLKSQKIMRLATIDPKGSPHIVPVWYDYSRGKFYVGTNTSTKKAKNIKQNSKISDRKSTRLNSSHDQISYAVFCLKKKKKKKKKNDKKKKIKKK